MWSISKVKEAGRTRFKATYWKSVLCTSIFAGLIGGTGYISTQFTDTFSEKNISNYKMIKTDLQTDPEKIFLFVGILLIAMLIGIVIGLAIGFVLDAFLYNPLKVGITRYSYRNLREDAKAREITYAFDHSYKNTVHVMFTRELHIFLWGLLFIIPGVVKGYQYRMVPYLLVENPDLDKESALRISKEMMDGNKWRAFLLDVSFIGWDLLSLLTVGILAIFYVNPYHTMANAALYDAIKFDYSAQNNYNYN